MSERHLNKFYILNHSFNCIHPNFTKPPTVNVNWKSAKADISFPYLKDLAKEGLFSHQSSTSRNLLCETESLFSCIRQNRSGSWHRSGTNIASFCMSGSVENSSYMTAHNKVCGLSWVTGSWFMERFIAVGFFKYTIYVYFLDALKTQAADLVPLHSWAGRHL